MAETSQQEVRTLRRLFKVGLLVTGLVSMVLGNAVFDYAAANPFLGYHIAGTLLIGLGGVVCFEAGHEK